LLQHHLRCSAKRNYRQGDYLRDSSSSSSSDDDGPEHSTTGIGDMFRLNSSQQFDIRGRLWRRRGAGKGCGKFALLESEHGVLPCLCKRYGRIVIFFIPTQMVPPKSAPPDDVSPV